MERYAPDDQGSRAARHGEPGDLPGDQGGPRRRTATPTTSTSTSRTCPRELIEEKLPDITEFARVYLRVEPTTEPVPIQPTAHYAMGGIPTDVDGRVVIGPEETPVPGLYAAGECACVSVHGANRLGTNSLLDIVVFGRRGGAHMARVRARRPSSPELPEAPGGAHPGPVGPHPHAARAARTPPTSARSCRTQMFDLAFVVRTRGGARGDAGDPGRAPRALRPRRGRRTRAACTTPS